MASVRQSLNVVGRPVSIRELVRLRNQQPFPPDWTFPLSLRKFIGALPPGRILRKVIPLDLFPCGSNTPQLAARNRLHAGG